LGHGDMTTMKDRVTSMKEEEPLSVSNEVVVVIE
jgi:hypothetical protein